MSQSSLETEAIEKLMSVEFPGVIEDLENMMSMIGGLDSLERTFHKEERLQLRFRPEDVYAHAVHGDLIPVHQMMVKFRRKLITYDDGSEEEITEPVIIGAIEQSYVFQSLCDFQYLPMKRIDQSSSPSNPSYVSIRDQLIPSDPYDYENLHNKEFNASAPLFILPTLFSRFDSVIDYHFSNGPEFESTDQSKEVVDQREKQVIGKIRKSRSIKAHDFSFKFTQEVPKEASPEIKKAIETGMEGMFNKQLFEKVQKCFEEKPLWTRIHLMYILDCKHSELKYVLPVVSFFWSDGPFKHTWNRFGYDPRLDKESRKYQTIDFRLRKYYSKTIDDWILPKTSRIEAQYQLPLQKKSTREKTSLDITSLSASQASTSSTEETSQVQRNKLLEQYSGQIFFKANVIPTKRQLVYQLSHIELESLQELVAKEPEKTTPDDKDGWLPHGSIDKIRESMKKLTDNTIVQQSIERGLIDEAFGSNLLKTFAQESSSSCLIKQVEHLFNDEEDDDQGY
jgi:general transcription factor 3C polypeptide 5 (transcription factor C subunit 1)